MEAGDKLLDFVGPLGKPTHIEKFPGVVVCVGGGIGVAPVHPIACALKEAGNRVISIIGARTKELLIMEEDMRRASTRASRRHRRRLLRVPRVRHPGARADHPARGQGERLAGHRGGPRAHDARLLQDDHPLRRVNGGEPESHHGGRHGHVRRLPRERGRQDEVRLRRRPGVRRPPGGFRRAHEAAAHVPRRRAPRHADVRRTATGRA